MRRDPNDIIKVGELHFLWYSKGPLRTGYAAMVWYATSPDGTNWTERAARVKWGVEIGIHKGKELPFIGGVEFNWPKVEIEQK